MVPFRLIGFVCLIGLALWYSMSVMVLFRSAKICNYQCLAEIADGSWVRQRWPYNRIKPPVDLILQKAGYKCSDRSYPHFCLMRANRTDVSRAVEIVNWSFSLPNCRLLQFDPKNFLTKFLIKGQTMLIVGDSISHEHFISLACKLGDYIIKEERRSWGATSSRTKLSLQNGAAIFFQRDDYLISVDNSVDAHTISWQNFVASNNVSILVLNTGAHGLQPGISMEHVARNVTSFIHRSHNGIFIYRELFRGHKNCEGFGQPSSASSSLFNWEQFDSFNRIWNREIASHKAREDLPYYILPAHHLNTRADAHSKPPIDCLHMCLPGPLDSFNDLLLTILEHHRKMSQI